MSRRLSRTITCSTSFRHWAVALAMVAGGMVPLVQAVEWCAVNVNCATTTATGTKIECVRNLNVSAVTITQTNTLGGASYCHFTANANFTFIARRPAGAPVTATCSFLGTFDSGVGASPGSCVISAADGLPVELLELEIE